MRSGHILISRFAFVLLCLLLWGASQAQQEGNDSLDLVGVPVVFHGDTLFSLYDYLGPFTAGDRVSALEGRLTDLVRKTGFTADSISSRAGRGSVRVAYRDTTIYTLTPLDIAAAGFRNAAQAASTHREILRSSLQSHQKFTLVNFLKEIGLIAIVVLVSIGLIWLINRGFRIIQVRIIRSSDRLIRRFKLHDFHIISVDRQIGFVRWVINILRIVFILVVLYLALPVIFSIIPGMEHIARTLIGYFVNPLQSGAQALIGYIPEMITIVIIIYVTRLLLRAMHSIARDVASERLAIKGFYPDWALPTYTIMRVIVYIFAFVLMFPLLPGSESRVFQGVSVFLGLLISLGSQSAIGNMIAGIVITYMRAFNVGDRVKIGATVGDVLERSMLVTRLRTIKNEVVTIPNSEILNNQTINYTSDQKQGGLVLYTSVTIGYDVPWRTVENLLKEAAARTNGLKAEPAPFVLQTSLDDFYISYQLNAYTDQERLAALIYSDLHANIQDVFKDANVEIMSPHYRVNRQTMESTIPEYKVPGKPEEDE